MNNKFYKVNSDLVLMGSISGSKRDAVSLVESQILKYATVPNECFYALKKDEGSVYHYEIQQRPKSGSVLGKVLKELKNQESGRVEGDSEFSDVFIYDRTDRQYQVYKRKDGTLRTFVRSHDEVILPGENGVENLTESPRPFHAYFSHLKVVRNVFGVGFLISTVAALFATSAFLTMKSIDDGYVNALKDSPSKFLFEERGSWRSKSVDLSTLPVVAGINKVIEFERDHPEKVLSKLVFENGVWRVEEKGLDQKGEADEQ